jgi:hypothetical protein
MTSDLESFYKNRRIVLWVEDTFTRAYLQTVWDDPDVQFLIGGGHENLRGITEDAHRRGLRHVFAVMDCDFRVSNRAQWLAPPENLRAYVLESLEVENLLLDASALAAASDKLGAHREAAELTARLAQHAGEMPAWMACRKVISDLSTARGISFPKHPKRSEIKNVQEAKDLILGSAWVTQTVPALSGLIAEQTVLEALQLAEGSYAADLASGRYLQRFAGKELLAPLKGYVFPSGEGARGAEDLAKVVAEQQRELGTVPREVGEILISIRTRLGMPPPMVVAD